MNNSISPTRVRIHSHVTKPKFLHVEDALNIGKIRLLAGYYCRGEGMNNHAHHFIDLADARLVFYALVRAEQGFSHKEYKGTPPQKNGNDAISRVLSLTVKGENVYIELKTGLGKLTQTGAIMPNGKAKVAVNVSFKLYEARRMAASVLAYIHAWDVLRMLVHYGMGGDQKMVGKLLLYTLTPLSIGHNGRSQNGHSKQDGHNSPTQLLLYGDGSVLSRVEVTAVSADNQTEGQAYARYRQEKGTAPPSKQALLHYYQQQVTV